MAKTWNCKSGNHEGCSGTYLAGAPQPVNLEKCKCDCHKGNKNA